MIAMNNTSNVDTIEDYTLYCLDRSTEGIDMLADDARACSDAIDASQFEMARRIFLSLVSNLQSLDKFEYQLCSLFQIDTGTLSDREGSLDTTERAFRATLLDMGSRLETGDLPGLSIVLRKRLTPILARFRNLLPLLKTHIAENYVPAHT